MFGINSRYDYLYDPQQASPAGWCPVCKREIYAEGKNLCRRCSAAEEGGEADV